MIKKVYNKFVDGCGFIASCLLVLVSLFVFLNVVCRLLGIGMSWLFDTCIIACIFMTYLGFFFIQRDNGHVALDTITSKLKPAALSLMDLLNSVIAVAFSAFNLWMVYVWFERVKANGLVANLAWSLPVWVFSVAMLFGWLMFFIVSVVKIFENAKKAAEVGNKATTLKFLAVVIIIAVVFIISFKIHIVLGMFVMLLVMLFMGVPVALSLGSAAAIAMYVGLGLFKLKAQFAILAYQGLNSVGITAAPLFILGGTLMFDTGCIGALYNLLDRWLGKKIPGVSLIITAITGFIFCAVTGSTVAAHAVLAMLCLPILRKRGYPDDVSCGMIGGAAVGTLVPPSNSFILIGLLTGLPIANIFMAGTMPAVILFVGYSIWAIVWAKTHNFTEDRSNEIEETPEQKKQELIRGLLGVGAPILCLGGMYGGLFTATEGGGIMVAYALIVGIFITKTITLEKLKKTMIGSTKSSICILFLLACAHSYSGVLTQTGITRMATDFVVGLNLSKTGFLIIYTVLMIIIGMFLNASSITLILYPITIPIYQALGIDPYFFAVYFTLLCELGALTPPVGINLFIIQSSADGLTTNKIFKGCIPIIIIMLLVTILIWIFPGICTFMF